MCGSKYNVLCEGATDAANVRRAPNHVGTGPTATLIFDVLCLSGQHVQVFGFS